MPWRRRRRDSPQPVRTAPSSPRSPTSSARRTSLGGEALDAYYRLIARFDEALDAAVENDYLTAALGTSARIWSASDVSRATTPSGSEASAAEHRLIAAAIAAGDADLAAHATHVHLHNALASILRSLDAAEAAGDPATQTDLATLTHQGAA